MFHCSSNVRRRFFYNKGVFRHGPQRGNIPSHRIGFPLLTLIAKASIVTLRLCECNASLWKRDDAATFGIGMVNRVHALWTMPWHPNLPNDPDVLFVWEALHYISQCLSCARHTWKRRQCVAGGNCCCDICIVNSAGSLWIRFVSRGKDSSRWYSVRLLFLGEFILRGWFNNSVTRITNKFELKIWSSPLSRAFVFTIVVKI